MPSERVFDPLCIAMIFQLGYTEANTPEFWVAMQLATLAGFSTAFLINLW